LLARIDDGLGQFSGSRTAAREALVDHRGERAARDGQAFDEVQFCFAVPGPAVDGHDRGHAEGANDLEMPAEVRHPRLDRLQRRLPIVFRGVL
jgi:hypothetical protein